MAGPAMYTEMLSDAVETLAVVGTRTREQIIDEWGEAVEVELEHHPAVEETEVWGGEPAYEYAGHDGPVTIYTVWVGGEPDRELADPEMAGGLSRDLGVEVTAGTGQAPDDLVDRGATAEERVVTRAAGD